MIMDAGRLADLPTTVQRKSLPPDLKPPAITEETWRKMRPDILILPGLQTHDEPVAAEKYTIIIVEIGYCSDTNHEVKIRAKQQQHAELATTLRNAGHTVQMHTITLGTTGTIHMDLQTTLSTLLIDPPARKTLVAKLHLHATSSAGNILVMRRHLEWQPGGG